MRHIKCMRSSALVLALDSPLTHFSLDTGTMLVDIQMQMRMQKQIFRFVDSQGLGSRQQQMQILVHILIQNPHQIVENIDQSIELATKKMSVSKNEWLREGKMLKLIQQKVITDFF